MTDITPAQQIAADALTEAVIARQLYVLQGVQAIDRHTDHVMITRIWERAAEVEQAGYPITVQDLLRAAEATAMERALLA